MPQISMTATQNDLEADTAAAPRQLFHDILDAPSHRQGLQRAADRICGWASRADATVRPTAASMTVLRRLANSQLTMIVGCSCEFVDT